MGRFELFDRWSVASLHMYVQFLPMFHEAWMDQKRTENDTAFNGKCNKHVRGQINLVKENYLFFLKQNFK